MSCGRQTKICLHVKVLLNSCNLIVYFFRGRLNKIIRQKKHLSEWSISDRRLHFPFGIGQNVKIRKGAAKVPAWSDMFRGHAWCTGKRNSRGMLFLSSSFGFQLTIWVPFSNHMCIICSPCSTNTDSTGLRERDLYKTGLLRAFLWIMLWLVGLIVVAEFIHGEFLRVLRAKERWRRRPLMTRKKKHIWSQNPEVGFTILLPSTIQHSV